MKKNILFKILFACIFFTSGVYAQDRIGIYIHGFQGGPEKWTEESLAPVKLIEEQIFDKYVIELHNRRTYPR